jgi:class 3 adenylate cyclase
MSSKYLSNPQQFVRDSIHRIRERIRKSRKYKPTKGIPHESILTYDNGYEVQCCALSIDIRNSSSLSKIYLDSTDLATLYSIYISEVTHLIQKSSLMHGQPSIRGDGILAVFKVLKLEEDISAVFHLGVQIESLIEIINDQLIEAGFQMIRVGIGISYGKALMIKAGSKGTGCDEIVWIGNVVNEASKLCDNANKDYNCELMVSPSLYSYLTELQKSLLSYNFKESAWEGYLCSRLMNHEYKLIKEELLNKRRVFSQLCQPVKNGVRY